MNIAEVLLKLQDIADELFKADEFALRLIEAYGPPRSTLAKLRQQSLSGKADLLWPKKLQARIALVGEAGHALDALASEWAQKKGKPRLLLATDGIDIFATDTKLDEPLSIPFSSLAERYDFFLPLGGGERYQAVADSPADIKAAGRLAKFYDAILEANPDWTAHKRVHELNLFMTRVLFCMFAQSTGIFEKDLFSRTLNDCTSIDGNDTNVMIGAVFAALDLDHAHRHSAPEYAKRFPYVNGGLFREKADVPKFSRIARRILIDAAKLNWAEINPDIFGSMIQAVVKPELRGELGMHYTSVPNIMKVLRPLFLDDIEGELLISESNPRKLEALLARVRRIRVFDPACGSGNFLIIAYKELCKFEMRVLEVLKRSDQQYKLPFSEIQLENFIGIEIEDFAVETAKLSLYIAQHQMNVLYKERFGMGPPDLPLRDSGRVVRENATRIDWMQVCPPDDTFETYIASNPPYLGHAGQSDEQKEDISRVLGLFSRPFEGGDYVKCWLLKGALYCAETGAKAGFVATNSVSQGEQVETIWSLVLSKGIELYFAYSSFKWKNSASHNAGVICVIVGMRSAGKGPKRIYYDNAVRVVSNISPYLVEGDNTIVVKRSTPLSEFPRMYFGNMPRDDGNLILSAAERLDFLERFPASSKFIRRLDGSQEFIKGLERWCLWIEDADVSEALEIRPIRDRIDAVREFRLRSSAESTVKFAEKPYRFAQIQAYGRDAIIVPRVSSETRQYLPVGLVTSDDILSDLAYGIYDAPPHFLAILSSRIHLVWTAAVSGRMKSDYRYSNTLVWNTFPMPALSEKQVADLDDAAWRMLAERERYAGLTIAELYDPEKMPVNLLEAHKNIDALVEGIYGGRVLANDAERLEHLFKRYNIALRKEEIPLMSSSKLSKRKVGANA